MLWNSLAAQRGHPNPEVGHPNPGVGHLRPMKNVTLKDSSTVILRPIHPKDESGAPVAR